MDSGTAGDAAGVDLLSNQPVCGELLPAKLAAGALPAETALRYAIEIGSALQQAHKRRLVHGSVAPQNIAITAAGARLLQPRDLPAEALASYRSPQQVRGQMADARSDIFSFGALLYEMVSGKRAFTGEGKALDAAILEQSPAPLAGGAKAESALAAVTASCLAKDPAQRRQRMQSAVLELKLALRAIEFERRRRVGTSAPAHRRGAARRPGVRWRRVAVIGLVALVLAAGALTAALYFTRPA